MISVGQRAARIKNRESRIANDLYKRALMNSKMSRIAPVALLAFIVACATNPVTGKRELSFMSEAQEISTGQESHPQILKEMGSYDHQGLQRYVSDIGLRLAKSSER